MTTAWDEIFTFAAAKEAQKLYGIAFLPRTGSTRLGDILCRSEILGTPKEWFNHKLRRRLVVTSGCRDLQQYYRYLKTVHRTGKVFGLEVTWGQARLVFDTEDATFFDDIQTWFYLRRRDFVSQGVSLYKAMTSGVFHSIQDNSEKRQVEYDGSAVMTQILRIFQQEAGFDRYFRRREILPTDLWYEDLVQQDPLQVVSSFAESLDLPASRYSHLDAGQLQSAHTRLSDDKSQEMVQRFNQDFPDFVEYWGEYRGEKLVKDFLVEFPQYSI